MTSNMYLTVLKCNPGRCGPFSSRIPGKQTLNLKQTKKILMTKKYYGQIGVF